MTIILHVTECLGGGVECAMAQYINESSPEVVHHVLAISGRNNDSNGILKRSRVVSFDRVSCSLAGACVEVYRRARLVKADYVHLHSSFAGVFGRLSPVPRRRIVYTPHCYAFEIGGRSIWTRRLFFALEQLLAFRTGKLAACGQYEAALSRRLGGFGQVIALNNAVSLSCSPRDRTNVVEPRVGMLGRVCEQKGVDFFVELNHELKKVCGPLRMVWIGGGSASDEELLRQDGVEVTGWLDREKAVSELNRLDLYVHTAAWEGNPIAVIEAAFLGLPIFARSIPSIDIYGNGLSYDSPIAMAEGIRSFLSDENTEVNANLIAHRIRVENTVERLRHALSLVYA
jgi:glycosyltransferase involved in cell wall biosynthesis